MLHPAIKNSAYRKPAILAVVLHVGLFLLLISSFYFSHDVSETVEAPSTIQASLVSPASIAKAVAKPAPAPKPAAAVSKPVEVAPQPMIKPTPEIKETAKPVIVAPPKPVIKKNSANAQQQKALDDALMQEESQSKKTSVKKTDKTAEALLDEQLQEESTTNARQAAQAQARSAAIQAEVDQYSAMILQQVQQNWIVPQKVEHLSCLLEVQIAPGGMVTQVRLLKSSGNDALDRSALAAVNKASPLPVPKDSAVFNAFRRFTITVKPEGSTIQTN